MGDPGRQSEVSLSMKTYTTKQGDTWDGIAYTELGDCARTKDLMWANQQHLGYCTFPAGIVLTLPESKIAASSINTVLPWKQVVG